MAVTVTFQLDEDTYAEACLAGDKIMRRRQVPLNVVLWTIGIALLLAFTLPLLANDVWTWDRIEREFGQWWLFGLLFLILIVLWAMRKHPIFSGARELREVFRKHTSLHGTRTYRFDEDGLHATGENFSANHPWSRFPKWAEDDRFVFLVLENKSFEAIPKRDIQSETDLQELRALFAEKIGPPVGESGQSGTG